MAEETYDGAIGIDLGESTPAPFPCAPRKTAAHRLSNNDPKAAS